MHYAFTECKKYILHNIETISKFFLFFLPTTNTLLNLKNDYFSQKKKKEVTFIYNLSIKAYFYFT